FNYFDKRLTNAYTESINSIIRQVERMGRCYSFDALRAKILFNEKLHKKRKPRFNSSAFNKAMLYDTFNWYEVNDHDITDNFGVDVSTLNKNVEKCDLSALFHHEIRITIFSLIKTNILLQSREGVYSNLTTDKGIHGMTID